MSRKYNNLLDNSIWEQQGWGDIHAFLDYAFPCLVVEDQEYPIECATFSVDYDRIWTSWQIKDERDYILLKLMADDDTTLVCTIKNYGENYNYWFLNRNNQMVLRISKWTINKHPISNAFYLVFKFRCGTYGFDTGNQLDTMMIEHKEAPDTKYTFTLAGILDNPR